LEFSRAHGCNGLAEPSTTSKRMFDDTRESLRRLRLGRPGKRFSQCYEDRIRAHGGRYSWSRLGFIALGVALVVGGLAIGWMPGPGGFIAIFGVALLAREFRPLARILDWLEPELRGAGRWTANAWRRMSRGSQALVVASTLLVGGGLGYAAISFVAERW